MQDQLEEKQALQALTPVQAQLAVLKCFLETVQDPEKRDTAIKGRKVLGLVKKNVTRYVGLSELIQEDLAHTFISSLRDKLQAYKNAYALRRELEQIATNIKGGIFPEGKTLKDIIDSAKDVVRAVISEDRLPEAYVADKHPLSVLEEVKTEEPISAENIEKIKNAVSSSVQSYTPQYKIQGSDVVVEIDMRALGGREYGFDLDAGGEGFLALEALCVGAMAVIMEDLLLPHMSLMSAEDLQGVSSSMPQAFYGLFTKAVEAGIPLFDKETHTITPQFKDLLVDEVKLLVKAYVKHVKEKMPEHAEKAVKEQERLKKLQAELNDFDGKNKANAYGHLGRLFSSNIERALSSTRESEYHQELAKTSEDINQQYGFLEEEKSSEKFVQIALDVEAKDGKLHFMRLQYVGEIDEIAANLALGREIFHALDTADKILAQPIGDGIKAFEREKDQIVARSVDAIQKLQNIIHRNRQFGKLPEDARQEAKQILEEKIKALQGVNPAVRTLSEAYMVLEKLTEPSDKILEDLGEPDLDFADLAKKMEASIKGLKEIVSSPLNDEKEAFPMVRQAQEKVRSLEDILPIVKELAKLAELNVSTRMPNFLQRRQEIENRKKIIEQVSLGKKVIYALTEADAITASVRSTLSRDIVSKIKASINQLEFLSENEALSLEMQPALRQRLEALTHILPAVVALNIASSITKILGHGEVAGNIKGLTADLNLYINGEMDGEAFKEKIKIFEKSLPFSMALEKELDFAHERCDMFNNSQERKSSKRVSLLREDLEKLKKKYDALQQKDSDALSLAQLQRKLEQLEEKIVSLEDAIVAQKRQALTDQLEVKERALRELNDPKFDFFHGLINRVKVEMDGLADEKEPAVYEAASLAEIKEMNGILAEIPKALSAIEEANEILEGLELKNDDPDLVVVPGGSEKLIESIEKSKDVLKKRINGETLCSVSNLAEEILHLEGLTAIGKKRVSLLKKISAEAIGRNVEHAEIEAMDWEAVDLVSVSEEVVWADQSLLEEVEEKNEEAEDRIDQSAVAQAKQDDVVQHEVQLQKEKKQHEKASMMLEIGEGVWKASGVVSAILLGFELMAQSGGASLLGGATLFAGVTLGVFIPAVVLTAVVVIGIIYALVTHCRGGQAAKDAEQKGASDMERGLEAARDADSVGFEPDNGLNDRKDSVPPEAPSSAAGSRAQGGVVSSTNTSSLIGVVGGSSRRSDSMGNSSRSSSIHWDDQLNPAYSRLSQEDRRQAAKARDVVDKGAYVDFGARGPA